MNEGSHHKTFEDVAFFWETIKNVCHIIFQFTCESFCLVISSAAADAATFTMS